MKIRNGFVSNSSSSSFIISNEHFKNVRDLAKYMINQKIQITNYDKLYIERLQNIDENVPVSFPSCNYDTYIRKVGDCYIVSTCNNTDWDLWEYTTKLSESAIQELNELKKTIKDNPFDDEYDRPSRIIDDILEGSYDFPSFGKDYYALDSEIRGVETYEYCDKHNTQKLWDTLQYGKICLECDPYHKRKDKLIAINNSSNK